MAGYGTEEGFATWLEGHGHVLPLDAPSSAVLRQRGSDYVDGLYGPRAPGAPAGGYAQPRAWPRSGATAYGQAIPDDVIPNAWIEASYAAAFHEAENPGGLAVVVTAAGAIKREKVGSLETEFFQGGDSAVANATPLLASVEGLIGPFVLLDTPAVSIGLWSIGR